MKELWVGRPPGTEWKEAATEDVRLYLTYSSFEICWCAPHHSRLRTAPDLMKSTFIELSGKVSCHPAHISVCVCVCVRGQKCVNQRVNSAVVRQDTASQQGAMIEQERANCRAEVWGVKSVPQGDLTLDIVVDIWVHHHHIIIPQGRSNMSATKTCVAYGRGLGPKKWVWLLCQNLRIKDREMKSV